MQCQLLYFFKLPGKSVLLKPALSPTKLEDLCPCLGNHCKRCGNWKLKISRTLWTCACAFNRRTPRFNVGLYPSVPPLLPLKYGSDGEERPASQYGGSSSRGRREKGLGRRWWACVSLCGILDVHRPKDRGVHREKKREREKMVGGLRAANGDCFQSCGPMLGLAAQFGASQGAQTAPGLRADKI